MSFGFDRQAHSAIGDSVILTAVLYAQDGETPIPEANITDVKFTIYKPGDAVGSPTIDGEYGDIVDDGTGTYVVDPSVNSKAGEYRSAATFTYLDGSYTLTKSVLVDYEIYDPFEQQGSSLADPAMLQAWKKIQGAFDSETGGPWLKDMAVATRFGQSTMRDILLPEVFLTVNQQMPFTDYNEVSFPYGMSDGNALLAEGLLIASIRHLIRSYTEQPNVVNSPVAFMDRRDYAQRWTQTLTIEQAQFDKWLKQWKLRAYDLSHAAVLLGSKAGRMLPAPMRSRNFGRGF